MLSHIDARNEPTMVDVSQKSETIREAHAECKVTLPESIMGLLENGELKSAKGPVFQTAIIAGTLAAKKTGDLIPFCHPLAIEDCRIVIDVVGPREIRIKSQVRIHGRTGVEMEALVACSVAALTVYDMCKALSHDIEISSCRLMKKTGGKNDFNREN